MKARFISTFELFFRAVAQQARDRKAGVIMDLSSYMALRRDTSGCRPCWAMIEYANGLDLPDEVMAHDVVETLGEATNDLVSWSNVNRHSKSLAQVVDEVFPMCRTYSRSSARLRGTTRTT